MRTPEQIADDVKRQRIREAAVACLAAGAPLRIGRVARDAGVSVDDVHRLFPDGSFGEHGWPALLAAA